MEKITYIYSHDTTNDTTIELVKCPGRTQIEIDFDMEDPNVGKEIAVYGTDEDTNFIDLAQEWLDEIEAYLDGDKSEADVYDDYTSNMWYCIANSLDWLISEKLTVRNMDGNEIRITTLENAAKIVKDEMTKHPDVRFDFGIGVEGRKIGEFIKTDSIDLTWYGVKLLPNDSTLFEGEESFEKEYIFVCGHWGGGNVTMTYYCGDSYQSIEDQDPEAEYLLKAMMESCGALNPNEEVLLEKTPSRETCLHDDNTKEAN